MNIVLGAVISEGKILLLKRAKEPFKGLWGLPGGKIEFGENIEGAVKREIEEETNLPVEFIAIRGLVNEIFYKSAQEKVAQSIIYVCEVRPKRTNHLGSEEGELNWFNLKDWRKLEKEIIPSDYKMVESFIINKRESIEFHKVKMLIGEVYKISETDL